MKRFNFVLMRISQYKKVGNFQRNVCSGHLAFPNEANFSPREDYLLMKVSAETFNVENLHTRGGSEGGIANTKPKYPLHTSGGHNYYHFICGCLITSLHSLFLWKDICETDLFICECPSSVTKKI